MNKLYYEDYGNGIYCIDIYYQRPRLAACYLLVEGDQAAVIETGTSHSVPLVLELMERLGIAPEQLRYVMPTHVHLDHAGGAGRMMAVFPQAKLVIHPFGARHMIDPAKLKAGTIAVYGEQKFRDYYGDIDPIDPQRVTEAPDDYRVSLNGRELRCIHTPGHARHHYCVYDAKGEGLFTGDTFGLGYPELASSELGAFMMATTTPVQFDPEAWYATLERMLALHPRYMYLTHFGRVTLLPELAQQLREDIAAHVEIAQRAPQGEQRKAFMLEAIKARTKERLHQRQCPLDDDWIDQLISGDAELNAQGLEVWLDRREA